MAAAVEVVAVDRADHGVLATNGHQNPGRQWARPNALLFSCLARESGAQFLVDSSKRAQRLYLLRRSGCFSLKVIHLRRDGRAIIHSYRKRGSSFGAGFRRWLDPTLASVVLRRRVGASDWMGLRYEDLASAPEVSLRRVCAFLDLEFEPGMLDFRAQPSIVINGNRMRYGRDQDIVIDNAWRLDFGRADRVKFALLGGVINRFQGYKGVETCSCRASSAGRDGWRR